MYYGFLLNMWVMRKATESDLQYQVERGRITQEEHTMITITPQNALYDKSKPLL